MVERGNRFAYLRENGKAQRRKRELTFQEKLQELYPSAPKTPQEEATEMLLRGLKKRLGLQ